LDNEISREISQHGQSWDKLHNGYFADSAVAACFIEKINSAVADSHPQVLVDLAGGTGFILSELINQKLPSSICLVNVDFSDRQLQERKDCRIAKVCKSISDFHRADADDSLKRFLFVMRSALHYFGKDGLQPLLQHLRSQMKAGEFFIHQTACFERDKDASCLNMIYQRMETSKWYPTVKQLSDILENACWEIKSVLPAPKLKLTSGDLTTRYGLSSKVVSQIRSNIIERYGRIEDVFEVTPSGFCAYLHYKIFTCLAM
jgi:hypothetical protein